MERREQLYEGKAKKVFATDDPNLVIVSYKDDATALNGLKRGTIVGKGSVNNRMSNLLMQQLEGVGVPTHFVKELSERETVVKKVTIVPLEVIVRNIAAGSMAKRLGLTEGMPLACTVFEICYKNDALGDPMINDTHAIATGFATREQLDTIYGLAGRVNDFLREYLAKAELTLVDFKLEFGVDAEGSLILADEISPDTCRLWDAKTGDRLDKDRFRRDMPDPEGAYVEVARRLL